MGFKRVYYRAEFDSGMSTQDIEDWVDVTFNRWKLAGIDGLIVGRDGTSGDFILEGDDTDVDNEVDTLGTDSDLNNGETLYSETSGSSSGHLYSHVDRDARDST